MISYELPVGEAQQVDVFYPQVLVNSLLNSVVWEKVLTNAKPSQSCYENILFS